VAVGSVLLWGYVRSRFLEVASHGSYSLRIPLDLIDAVRGIAAEQNERQPSVLPDLQAEVLEAE
jgi:hypothetical protein